MKSPRPRSVRQPAPQIPGLTRQMIKEHAARLYRDVFPSHPQSKREWHTVEEDLARKIERDGM